ncbi:MAG TPA: trypsin-like peptidase domain-containing protein [Thermoanaerobaculia bacterium]|nr:trypsin-like peptidase domain-containing protein [Thermoanaerobaculia bacterium]
MPIRPVAIAITVLCVVAGACRYDAVRLDDVQKMAYEVKPAVVRVSAFATAEFRYGAAAIREVEAAMKKDGFAVASRNLPEESAAVETGAGGSGTGFIVHPQGHILTNGHVVAPTRDLGALESDLRRNGAISALVRHFPVEDLRAMYREERLDTYISRLATRGALERMRRVNEVELSNGEKLSFDVVGYSPSLSERGSDLALLHVERRGLPSLRLGDSESVGIGESIWSIGYPAVASSTDDVIGGWLSRDSDLEATFNPGTITAIKKNSANAPVFQSNVAIYRGNSGGPAVNRSGDVIGISTWGHTSAEQIKFLVPVNAAKTLMKSAGVEPNVEGDFNRYYGAALEGAATGRWDAARKNLVTAARLFPNSPDLIRFHRDAERALTSAPFWQRHAAVAAAGGGALVIAAVGSVVVVAGRRRRRSSMPIPRTTSESLVAPAGRVPEPSILGKFTILNGERAGEKLGLGGSGIRIGRESAICEIVLQNPKVSRLHAEVVSIDGKVLLIDRNSSNGTFVNDQKIDKRFLQDGDIIHFGGRNAVAVAFHA